MQVWPSNTWIAAVFALPSVLESATGRVYWQGPGAQGSDTLQEGVAGLIRLQAAPK
jgi:hypothetical protein